MKKSKFSLRTGLSTIIVVCWLVPIVMIVVLAGVLLGDSYEQSARQEVDAAAGYALRQVALQLEGAISDSKSVSYDGTVRAAYRSYQQSGNAVVLYRSVNDYLTQSFSRNERYKAVFISFWDQDNNASAYMLGPGTKGYGLVQTCRRDTPAILEVMAQADTEIRFLLIDGQLYMARNLLDSHFSPYASVVMLLEPSAFFQPLTGVSRVSAMQLELDELRFAYDGEAGSLNPEEEPIGQGLSYEATVDGHSLRLTADTVEYRIWSNNPTLIGTVIAVALLALPLLLIMVLLFRKHVSRPMETLVEANLVVQSGERGYEIPEAAPNAEFDKLYEHFNDMSAEMKNQFERSYLEQQAAQRAQIKALQSQINPHFLNNTLEIINWEARLAGNDRVSAMIEALSTMLDAALDRDGRTQIPLKQELGYVDAYLYIIQERLGEGFHVYKEIDQSLLTQQIPRLILQPIVENAVEHDITARRGGDLWVRARREGERLCLEVEHDGSMTAEDEEKIRTLLSDQPPEGGSVGLRNVNQRLKLIYGEAGRLEIGSSASGTILARISFPAEPEERRSAT